MSIELFQTMSEVPEPQRLVAQSLIDEWEPGNSSKLNYWVGGKQYVLSWHANDQGQGHHLQFFRNWTDSNRPECDRELVWLEAMMVPSAGSLVLEREQVVLFTGHASEWTDYGQFAYRYHTREELDALRILRERYREDPS